MTTKQFKEQNKLTLEISQILALVLEELCVVFSRRQIAQFLESLSVCLTQLDLMLQIRHQLVKYLLYIPGGGPHVYHVSTHL